jgi:hypothetical protein
LEEYSFSCQPVIMLRPNRPCEMLSIVTAMRAAIGGGSVSTEPVANNWMRLVTAARPAEPAQLDHRQREFHPIALGPLHHRAVEIERGFEVR